MRQKNLRDATKDNKSDIKLFAMSLAMLVSYSLTCWVLYQFTCCFNGHYNDDGWYFAIMEFWFYAADLNFLLPPWLLLITSTTVRREFKKTF
uniref:Uncharacterized protein n=1 Tax=Acrobeloides nanus TaxID=290746 RepID=A0A914E9K5_9BILA